MQNKFVANWIAVVCVIAALLFGAWMGAQFSSSTVSQDDWITGIETGNSY